MKKSQIGLALVVLSLFFAFMPAQHAQGAAATAATVELSAPNYVADTPVTIQIKDVAASGASFNVYFTYDSSGTDTLEAKSAFANISVQLGSGDTSWHTTFNFPAPTAGSYIRVHVCGSASGTTTDLDSSQIQVRQADELLPVTFWINFAVPLLIMLIFASIGLGFLGKKLKK